MTSIIDNFSPKEHTPTFLAGVKIIDAKPTVTNKEVGQAKNVRGSTIQRAFDVINRPSRPRVQGMKHGLTDRSKSIRVTHRKRLLIANKHAPAREVRFFSDKKIFTVDAVTNYRNHR